MASEHLDNGPAQPATESREQLLEALRATVKAMREHQRQYFRTRSQTELQASKRLEREVDDLIGKIDSGQGLLFGEGRIKP